jgi:hypothetical protein
MEPLQVIAVVIALAHTALLTSVYFSTSMATHAYVSTEIEGQIFFRTLLTCIVVFEHIVCATYLCLFNQFSNARLAISMLSVCAASAGWSLLASHPTENPVHLIGAIIFIASTSIYSLLLILQTRKFKPWFLACGALALGSALAFAGLYFAQNYALAATFEWLAFVLDAVLLGLFFTINKAADAAALHTKSTLPVPQQAEFIMPLLHPRAAQYLQERQSCAHAA